MKSRDGESEKRREEERRSKKRKSQKKEDPGARKGRKVAKQRSTAFFQWRVEAGAEPAGQMRDEKIARRSGAKHISRSTC